uniref:LSM domain-containing protein n=1 Tax=Urocitellus parryii TaxID=9999 RepID=A0A8D2HGQ9_UROPR
MAANATTNPSQLLPLELVDKYVTEFEITPEGRRITKLDQILLNGNNITMLVPGGEGPEV